MPDIDPAEIAVEQMLLAARNVSEQEIRNAIGDCAGSADLTGDETDELVKQVRDLIDTADIEIDPYRPQGGWQ